MAEDEFLGLDFLSHLSCESITYNDKGFLVLTVGVTKPDRSPDRSSETRFQFVLDHAQAAQWSRALSNAVHGVSTLY